MNYVAIFGVTRIPLDIPFFGRSGDEHFPRRGAHSSQVFISRPNGRTSSCNLISILFFISNTKDNIDIVQIDLELLSNHLRNRGIGALAHLCPVVQNSHLAGTVN
jgi:hypothetical protein